ncbi:MAG TPA: cytochrome P450 [Polyangia bacterium]|nr:cytochrome P450 [Polyangia bacterium]
MSESVQRQTPPGLAGFMAMMGPEFLANPYPFYDRLRNLSPVLRAPGPLEIGAWLVTSHSACSSVLRSKHFGKEGQKVLPPEKLALIPQESMELVERRRNNMLFRDPPDHTRLRGLVSQAFTPRTIEGLRPHIGEIAEHLLAQAKARGQMDLISDFAFPLPIIVIAELLGVPPEERDRFKAWSNQLIVGLSPLAQKEDFVQVGKAIRELDDYLGGVIEERRRAPRQDLISELIQAQEAGDQLSQDEMVATCRLLLTAGHETTVNLIGNGMLALLRHPEEWARLGSDPSLLPGAIEELLRYDSPVQMTIRFTFEDTELGGQAVKRGDLVMLLTGAANHDPEQYAEPGRLDIGRKNAHTHLAFGSGIHYCLGAPLARLEGQIAIGALLRHMPGLQVATETLEWRQNPVLRGLKSFPVTF